MSVLALPDELRFRVHALSWVHFKRINITYNFGELQ